MKGGSFSKQGTIWLTRKRVKNPSSYFSQGHTVSTYYGKYAPKRIIEVYDYLNCTFLSHGRFIILLYEVPYGKINLSLWR